MLIIINNHQIRGLNWLDGIWPDFYCNKRELCCFWEQWRSAPGPSEAQSHQKLKQYSNLTSLLVHLMWDVLMLSAMLTGTVLTAAVKLMGSSCPPGHRQICWGLYCACQSAGQFQRGKFKNGFWSIKCSTVKYSRGVESQVTQSSVSTKTGELLWFLCFSVFVCFVSTLHFTF